MYQTSSHVQGRQGEKKERGRNPKKKKKSDRDRPKKPYSWVLKGGFQCEGIIFKIRLAW